MSELGAVLSAGLIWGLYKWESFWAVIKGHTVRDSNGRGHMAKNSAVLCMTLFWIFILSLLKSWELLYLAG